MVDFDYLMTEDKLEEDSKPADYLPPQTGFRTYTVADCNVAKIKENDIMQFETRGFFSCSRAVRPGKPAVFFNIPIRASKLNLCLWIYWTKAAGSRINRQR